MRRGFAQLFAWTAYILHEPVCKTEAPKAPNPSGSGFLHQLPDNDTSDHSRPPLLAIAEIITNM